MYYKQRKMDAENQLFFYRVGQLPVVKAASERVVHAYELTKNSNRLFNATLQLAENTVKYASEVDAVKKILDNQLVTAANNIAVNQLDKIEHGYPIVNKTPDELWKAGKNYYEHSRLKGNIDTIYSAKNYSVTKVTDTKMYYQNLLSDTLNNLLAYSDSMVDKYVAVQSDTNGQPPQCGANSSYFGRVHCISGKFYHGVKYRTGEKYDATKEYVVQTLGDLHVAMLLIDYAKNTAAWANEKTHATLTTAQQQATALWHEIQRRTEPISDRSEAIVLSLVQSLTANIAALSQQVAKYSSPYLPEGVEKTVAAGAVYANELRDAFAKAKTLGDLRDEVMTEAKQKFGYVQDGLMKGLDHLFEFPPVCWLVPARFKISGNRVNDEGGSTTKEKAENGHIEGGKKKTGAK